MSKRGLRITALVLILAAALGFRLYNIRFGLPSLHDPDEPIFILKALELLQDRTLNPRWFGHPGTTTIYLLALMDIVIVGLAVGTGQYADVPAFAQAAYQDPALLFFPARVVMAVLGTAAVALTFYVARRGHGWSAALLASALLAFNGLHISWSQVVRTDIHASVFMLLSLLFSMRAFSAGKWRDYLLAGVFAGCAIATKWPAAAVFMGVLGASTGRLLTGAGNWRREARLFTGAGVAMLAGLLLSSPYLLLDWETVRADLTGEGRPTHLGHTGEGLWANLLWYMRLQVAGTMGLFALLLAGLGAVLSVRRHSVLGWTLVPATAVFLIMISAQNLVWSRWILPVLPMLCVLAAIGAVSTIRLSRTRIHGAALALFAALLVGATLIPSILSARAQARERLNDTRSQAATWAVANFPPGSTVVLEHLELKLRPQPWRFLFPIGASGCVDARHLLNRRIGYDEVQQKRRGSNIVDLGNVAPDLVATCRADFAILTYYDLYLLEASSFPVELSTYGRILEGGRTVALFRPKPGQASGPVVRIVAIPQR